MEADDRDAAPRAQEIDRLGQSGTEATELVIDRNAQCLEDARRRVNALARWRGFGSRDDGRQLVCHADGSARALGDDGAGDAAGKALLAVLEEDTAQLRLRQTVDQLGCGALRARTKAHIERTGVLEAESPLRDVELRGADAEIEEDPVDRRKTCQF